MTILRAITRAGLLMCLTLFVYGTFFTGKITRLAGRGHGWRNGCFRWWAKAVCRILGLRTSAIGTPPHDALIVSNHISYIDIVLLASYVDVVFVAKSDIAGWPLIGMVCKGIDTIFIDRTSKRDVVKVGEQIEKRLEAGLGVVVFPEGTSSPGEEVLPFKPSLLEVAARDELPVHYATVRYTVPDNQPTVAESVAWWGDMDFMPHVWGLMQLGEIRAEVVFGENAIVDADRKRLAVKLQEAVAGQL